MIQKMEKPMRAFAQPEESRPREKAGADSMKPMKNRTAGKKVKAGLMMVEASCRLQGAMVIQSKSQGTEREGIFFWIYQASKATPAAERRFKRMKGASGIARR